MRTKQVSELESSDVVRRYGVSAICTPLQLGGVRGGKMMDIAYLVAIMTCWYGLLACDGSRTAS